MDWKFEERKKDFKNLKECQTMMEIEDYALERRQQNRDRVFRQKRMEIMQQLDKREPESEPGSQNPAVPKISKASVSSCQNL